MMKEYSMKCFYHPARNATAECGRCHRLLCGECAVQEKGDKVRCSQCVAVQSARDAVQGFDDRVKDKERRERERQQKERRKETVWFVLQWAILLCGVLVISIQAPAIVSSMKDDRPVRNGTYETDPRTDQCIGNLWRGVRALQEGKMPGPELLCPETNKAYIIEKTQGDTFVRCPNPERHRLKEIRASKQRPVPEVVK